MNSSDDLYSRARELLRADPTMGKQRLADRLGVQTPTSRRLKHRFLGETQGHSTDPAYQRVRQLKAEHLEWGATRIAQELGMSLDHAKVHLARWTGAQAFEAANTRRTSEPPTAIKANQPAADTTDSAHAGSTLQDAVGDKTRDLCYRGSRITCLEDLLVYAQVDTAIWEVERWLMNKCVGNDFYHTDILGRTTTAGTPQDSSITWKIAFVQGWNLLVRAIERFRTIAPVHVPVAHPNPLWSRGVSHGSAGSGTAHEIVIVVSDTSPLTVLSLRSSSA